MAKKRKQLTDLFRAIDADDSGSASTPELEAGLLQAGVAETVADVHRCVGRNLVFHGNLFSLCSDYSVFVLLPWEPLLAWQPLLPWFALCVAPMFCLC